jgi:subtilisin family serine protease
MATFKKVKFGGKKGKPYRLRMSDDIMVVRTQSRRSVRAAPLSTKARDILSKFESVFTIPEVGVEVLRCGARRSVRTARDKARLALQKEASVRFAGRGLCSMSGRPVLYTENLFVQFQEDCKKTAIKRILKKFDLRIKRELAYATNAWFVELPEGSGHQKLLNTASTVLAHEDVLLCHPELVQEMGKRGAFPEQWHLKRATVDGKVVNAHANVEAAWTFSQGEGTTIAVIDDGVDVDHQEFVGAGKVVAPRDVTRGNDDARPGRGNMHGTACAGVACANGLHGASGVAPRARLLPIRLVSSLGSQAEADAFVWATDHGADVISCSWGPMDGDWWNPDDPGHNDVVPIPDSTRLAIDYAVREGRAGKGCVITWAAGNGNESVDNDGYASYSNVLAIAASNDRGKKADYSDTGKALWCAFPSSNGEPSLTPGIWTTDVSGAGGYNSGSTSDGDAAGHYTNSFGGTSSACPGAAGVAALVIARDPELRWEQVKELLKKSCDKIDSSAGRYDASGHSVLYGYGRLNAKTAVELAAPASAKYTAVHKAIQSVPIQDLKTARLQVAVADTATIRAIKVHVDLEHSWIGDLTVKLKPPTGTGVSSVLLHERQDGGARNIHRIYDVASTPALATLGGTVPAGIWKLEVHDRAKRDVGEIRSFAIELEL